MEIGLILINIVIVLGFLILIKSLVWWYFGINEMLTRLDKNYDILTDIRELLQKSIGEEI